MVVALVEELLRNFIFKHKNDGKFVSKESIYKNKLSNLSTKFVITTIEDNF